jgi:hypothetical protein
MEASLSEMHYLHFPSPVYICYSKIAESPHPYPPNTNREVFNLILISMLEFDRLLLVFDICSWCNLSPHHIRFKVFHCK